MDISDKNLLYKIVCARDKRYDGRFYCGVVTTGIYCRPICPARPKLENITFYRSSTEAEKAGFRPCLRCRPDHAPSSAHWNGTAATVGRALTLISRGAADDVSIETLAERLGVSDRHSFSERCVRKKGICHVLKRNGAGHPRPSPSLWTTSVHSYQSKYLVVLCRTQIFKIHSFIFPIQMIVAQ